MRIIKTNQHVVFQPCQKAKPKPKPNRSRADPNEALTSARATQLCSSAVYSDLRSIRSRARSFPLPLSFPLASSCSVGPCIAALAANAASLLHKCNHSPYI